MKSLLRKLVGRVTPEQTIREAQQLFDRGQILEAIEHLTEQNRRTPSVAIEQRLMEFRHRGFFELPRTENLEAWPPVLSPSEFRVGEIPAVESTQLTSTLLAQSIFGHGALVVRSLLNGRQIDAMVATIDRAYEAFDAGQKEDCEEAQAWFSPLQPLTPEEHLGITRKWVRTKGGGVWAADSPRGFFNLLETLKQCGIMPVLTDYLGEPPALSMKKTTLRRVSPQCDPDWHQDGAFLGKGIRTINLWIALTDCGVDAPSMDMVPIRLPGIIPTGLGNAQYAWSADDVTVRSAVAATPPVRLHFKAGDAVLFDELNMHRTAVDQSMTKERYAVEAWFFAPSSYPLDQVPILC